jgi:hypothetical protein
MTDQANTVANTAPAPVAQTAPVVAQTAPVVVATPAPKPAPQAAAPVAQTAPVVAKAAPAVPAPIAAHEARVKSETSFLRSVGEKLGERHDHIQSANAAAPVVAVANNVAASTKVLEGKGNEERAFLTGILKDIKARLISL